MDEAKEKSVGSGEQKRRRYNRRRRKPSDAGQQNSGEGQQKSLANGGYSKQNQNANRERQSGNREKQGANHEKQGGNAGGNGRNRRNNHRSGRNGASNASFPKEREGKRQSGYQPDSGRDAIRSFDLGTCESEGKTMVFHFDKGTYSIAERKVTETIRNEDGEEVTHYEDIEISSTRDKAAAYKAWNDIKRPQKGKAGREKKEDTE